MIKRILFFIIIFDLLYSSTVVVDINYDAAHNYQHCEDGDYITNNIKDALAHSSDGDTVKICSGEYDESKLEIDVNITMEGVGDSPDDVNISGNDGEVLYTNGDLENVILKNFHIIQNDTDTALDIDQGTKFLIEDIKIDSKGDGLYLNDIYDSNVSDVNIQSDEEALYVNNSYDGLRLKDSVFISNNSDAVYLNNIYDDLLMDNCECKAVNSDGIYINNSNYVDIENSYIHDTANNGLFINNNKDKVDLKNNRIENPGDYGVYIKNGTNPGTIQSNIIKNANQRGLYLLEDDDSIGYYVTNNCFESGQDKNAFNRDENATFDKNYYNDWDGSGDYEIPDIPVYDNNPLDSCNVGNVNYSFNAVSEITNNDASEDWDNNVTTQIVNKSFDVYILSKDADSGDSKDANITKVVFNFYTEGNGSVCSGDNYENVVICDDSTSTVCPDTNDSGEVEISNIKIDKAVHCIQVYIKGKQKDSDEDEQDANSSDDFAIRPDKFDITNIPDKVKAGSEFNLTILALDYSGNSSKDYNETLHTDDNSTKVEYNITKSGCDNGKLDLIDGEDFADGEANATFKYNEVGELNVTIKEINGSEFAKIDADDTPDDERFITPVTKTVTFIPHHFYADINVSNFDENFTYLDNNLSIYSLIDLNITSQNEQNDTTKNYNTKCYAKDVDVNLTPKIFRHDENLSKDVIYKVFYEKSTSGIYKNSDINFTIDESNFTTEHNGSAYIKIHINFEKNISTPESPFEYNISGAEINNSDVNETYADINGSALFYYGFINMNDIITVKDDFNISHKITLFGTNGSDTYLPSNTKEIIINWYLNTLNKQKDANISNFVVTKGYVYNDDVIDSVDVDVNDINDSLNLHIKRNDESVKFAVVHIIDSNASHLWYSKFGKEYNISKDSSCAEHFCFSITWKSGENENGVISGDTNGTKADVNSSGINKKGVKLFR